MTATRGQIPPVNAASGQGGGTAIEAGWRRRMAALREALSARGASASRTLVLLPYAQLMAQARLAWRQGPTAGQGGLVPRFETTRNWAAQLAPFEPEGLDHGPDPARNRVLAQRLLEQAGGTRAPADLLPSLVEQLIAAAGQLAPLAAAVPPDERPQWGESLRESLQPLAPGGAAAWEALAQAVALEWVRHSRFATDVLWQHALPGQGLDALVLLQGLQPDPLAQALAERWDRAGQPALRWPLSLEPVDGEPELHPCANAQDEAQRAAAVVVSELNAGRVPVALAAQDRVLTRRIHALLQGAGVPVRDETGWRLSTSHAAARLMALLRAASPRASSDEVIDALKHLPQWAPEVVDRLERQWREAEVSTWAAVLARGKLREALPEGLDRAFDGLRSPRRLLQWLIDLAQALRDAGLWALFEQDLAGRALLRALWLDRDLAADPPDWLAQASRRMPLAAFGAWLREVLEAANFLPPSPDDAPVVVLPLAQLLARPFAAVVVPGCDDVHLSAAPEPPGMWSAEQRTILGLPDREALAHAAHAAWLQLLTQPRVALLWRGHEGDEPVLPNPWVMALWAARPQTAADPRPPRALSPQPVAPPMPSAPMLLPNSLSASAYGDLRTCPYRFFALRQLRLGESPELENEPGKRELGIWLHAVLKSFHEARPDRREWNEDLAQLDALAESEASAMGLDDATFLPFRALWPALRDGYLAWLHQHEEAPGRPGPRFHEAEVAREAQLGRWRIRGQLDRIDRQRTPEGEHLLVIDYKTESRARTEERVKSPFEDTQLAFYAALSKARADTLEAGYLSLGEGRDEVALIRQPELEAAREALERALPEELERVARGAPMPALGEGMACDYCAARGLCRKDFWT
jgi:ATP-dependent helicase/nuclease subunit B